jgi:MFS family permease
MFHSVTKLYKEAYGGLSRNIWLLSLVMFINRSGTMVLAFLTLYNKELGYSVQQGGWMVAIYGIGSFIGSFLGGKLSDSHGFYYVQFGALILGGLLFILLGLMSGYVYICSCIFFLSIVNESFRPANASAIFQYSTSENRTKSFSLIRLAINLGWGIGIVLGGLLASVNYHLLFWVDGCTNVFAALVLWVILPKKMTKPQLEIGIKHLASKKSNSLSPFKDLDFLIFLVLVVFFSFLPRCPFILRIICI